MGKDTACVEEGLGVSNIFRGSLRGSYTPGGKVEIILPGTMETAILESTVFHENTHKYLFQSTSYGFVQQFVSLLSQHHYHLPEQLKKKVKDLLGLLLDQSLLVHEGAATYRQYCWIRTQISKEVADKYVREKPEPYQSGFTLFATAVEAADLDAFDDEATALLLAEAALLTDILDHLPDILEGKTDALTSSLKKDSPNTRMKQIAATLASASDKRRLKIPEELLAAVEDGKLPLMTREYAEAWKVLLAGVGEITNIPLYGQQDYPDFFLNRLRELQDVLSKKAEENGVNMRFNAVLPPSGHDEQWAWALAAEADVFFVPEEYPMLQRIFEPQSVEIVQKSCLEYLRILGPEAKLYVHLFLPRRLKEMPIDLEFEEDADRVLLFRAYSSTTYQEKELIVRLDGDHIAELLSHHELDGRVAISCAFDDAFPVLSTQAQDDETKSVRISTTLKLLENRNIFFYPSENSFSKLKEIAFRLCQDNPLKWGVLLSQHWRTALVVLGSESTRWFFAAQTSEMATLEFLKWTETHIGRITSPEDDSLYSHDPTKTRHVFCSHYIRFGY
jgi:hypothetical protein